MDYLSVRNWAEYQHYNKPRPVWIKLYTRLLRDYNFSILPDASKAHLIGLFLLAAQNANKIPANAEWLQKELSATEPVNLTKLKHFISISRGSLEQVYTTASPYTKETETETETERTAAPPVRRARVPGKPKQQIGGDDGAFLRAFDADHRRVLKAPYLSQVGRDRKVLRGALKVHPLPKLLELNGAFWKEQGKYQADRESTYTGRARPDIPGFVHSIPNLIRDYEFDNKAVAQ